MDASYDLKGVLGRCEMVLLLEQRGLKLHAKQKWDRLRWRIASQWEKLEAPPTRPGASPAVAWIYSSMI
jgi:hypothetical protein